MSWRAMFISVIYACIVNAGVVALSVDSGNCRRRKGRPRFVSCNDVRFDRVRCVIGRPYAIPCAQVRVCGVSAMSVSYPQGGVKVLQRSDFGVMSSPRNMSRRCSSGVARAICKDMPVLDPVAGKIELDASLARDALWARGSRLSPDPVILPARRAEIPVSDAPAQ